MCDRCEELEERVAELEAIVQHFEVRSENEDEPPGLTDLYFGGQPLGVILENAVERSKENKHRLDQDGMDDAGVTPEVRNALLEVHSDWIDIQEERTEQFRNEANRRRAAKLFARFIDKTRPDSAETGVIADQDALKMSGDRAQEIIAAEDSLPQSGRSITVRRVFGRMVRGANRHDCSCDDWAECAHGLFRFRNEDGYQIAVDEADWREYLSTVVETIEAVESVTAADDEPIGSEDLPAHASSEMDDLLSAEVADD